MTGLDAARKRVRERVDRLPDAVRDCERCEGTDCMAIRRSSLNEGFHADDVTLKCMLCWHTANHGIPFDTPEEFERELDGLRDGQRTLDFALDGVHDVATNLQALGYTSKATEVDR